MKYTKADCVLLDGTIYSIDSRENCYESIVVQDGKIVFLGKNEQALQYIGSKTKVIRLHGKMVLPSFVDSHMHPPGIMLVRRIGVDLTQASEEHNLDSYLNAIQSYAKEHPEQSRIYGYGWNFLALDGEEAIHGPRKERLDALKIPKPIIMYSYDYHSLWLNSMALEEFHIEETTAFSGEGPSANIVKNYGIARDKFGPLWGILKEDAMMFVDTPEIPMEILIESFLEFQEKMYSYGITAVANVYVDYMIGFTPASVYRELEKRHLLKLRIAYMQDVNPHYAGRSIKEQVEQIVQLREEFKDSQYVSVIAGKLFIDGVVDSRTAYVHYAYSNSLQKTGAVPIENGFLHGYNLWENYETELTEAIDLLNQNGLQAHFHVIGDEAATFLLDVLDRRANSTDDSRNVVTHLQLLKRQDIPRIKKHHLVASLQTYWDYKIKNDWKEIEYERLGELAEYQYPVQSLLEEGILVAGASDYPITEPNPIQGIQIGVTRNFCYGEGEDRIETVEDRRYLLNRWERPSLKDMIKAYTSTAAYANCMEEEIGTLEVGKYADFIVLSENLYEVDVMGFDKVKVEMTFFEGDVVYSSF